MKRTFIGFKLNMLNDIYSARNELKKLLGENGVKWTNVDNLHITLCFIGNTENDLIPAIKVNIIQLCKSFKPFEVQAKGLLAFPSFSKPRVLGIEIAVSNEVFTFQKELQISLQSLGLKLDLKPYRPHMTLARIKYMPNKSALINYMNDNYLPVQPRELIDEIIYFESILNPQGPTYKPIKIFRLN